MDAFAFAVGFARIDPRYFWFDMDFRELSVLVSPYREDWEKTRLVIQALTGERIPMPWDDEVNAKQLAADLEKANAQRPQRIAAAATIKIN